MVHYVLSDHDRNKGEHRPAIIVRIFDPSPTESSVVNLQVITDDANDGMHPLAWRTSVHQDPTGKIPGTWHEMERVEQPLSPAAAAS